jgi:hypothetical protein
VLASDTSLIPYDIARTSLASEWSIIRVLEARLGDRVPKAEIRAYTLMALSWVDAAARAYLLDDRPSLLECFDEIVAACVDATGNDLASVLAKEPPRGHP